MTIYTEISGGQRVYWITAEGRNWYMPEAWVRKEQARGDVKLVRC